MVWGRRAEVKSARCKNSTAVAQPPPNARSRGECRHCDSFGKTHAPETDRSSPKESDGASKACLHPASVIAMLSALGRLPRLFCRAICDLQVQSQLNGHPCTLVGCPRAVAAGLRAFLFRPHSMVASLLSEANAAPCCRHHNRCGIVANFPAFTPTFFLATPKR